MNYKKFFFDEEKFISLYFILFISFIIFAFLINVNKDNIIVFSDYGLIEPNGDWYYYYNGEKQIINSKDFVVKSDKDEFTIYKTFKNDVDVNDSIAVSGIFFKSYIIARIDGQKIYELYADDYNHSKNLVNIKSRDLIRLPKNIANRTISITVKTIKPMKIHRVESLYMGTKTSILYNVIKSCWINMLFVFIYLIISIVFFVLHLFMNKNNVLKNAHYINLYYSNLIFLISCYLFANSNLSEFILPNSDLKNIVTFLPLYTMPISYLFYKGAFYDKNTKFLYNFIASLILIYDFVIYLMTYFKFVDYYETLPLFHIILCLVLIYSLYKSIMHMINKKKFNLEVVNMIILFILICVSLLKYWIIDRSTDIIIDSNINKLNWIIAISFLILFIIGSIVIHFIEYIFKDKLTSKQKKFLNELKMFKLIFVISIVITLIIKIWIFDKIFITNIIISMLIFSFIIIESFIVLKYNLDLIDNETKISFYKNMANRDMMSKLYNRNKYELDLKTAHKNYTAAIAIDINDLKKINDTLGHKSGDEIIIACSEIIFEVFVKKYKYRAFRTGGDEFAVFAKPKSEEELIDALKEFSQKIIEKREDIPYFAASFGSSFYNKAKDIDFNECIQRADAKMYKMKREYKEKMKNKIDYSKYKVVV